MTQGKSIEHAYWYLFNTSYKRKVFVGNDSFKTPPVGETSHALLRCDFDPFFHTVFKSWRFCGPLLWALIFSSFHRFSIGFKSGDWLAILAALLSFSETNWEFPWLCVCDYCLAEMSNLVSSSSSWCLGLNQLIFISTDKGRIAF